MTRNDEILDEEEKYFAGADRVYYFDMVIDSGTGAVVRDVAGNEYIDLLASASATNTGHAHPAIVKSKLKSWFIIRLRIFLRRLRQNWLADYPI